MAGQISMGGRREIRSAVAERYRLAGRAEKGRILDELCKVTGWHRKHAVRALANRPAAASGTRQQRASTYDVVVKDTLTALWEASDRICGKRLKFMIPILLPALERHGRLKLGAACRVLVLAGQRGNDRPTSGRHQDRGGRRQAPSRRLLFRHSTRSPDPHIQRLAGPATGLLRDRHGCSRWHERRGSFIQTLTMVDVATGWTECLPLVRREGNLVAEAIKRAQSVFPWIILGADFDNDSAFMNDIVVPWCRAQKIEVTRSRAYKKNDQALVEQKNGAVVRRLMGYGRFDGIETAQVMARLYAAARLHVNFFQPSFKLKEKRREGAKVIKRYHVPATPYERALAHPKLPKAIKRRLREIYRSLDPVALLAEIRAAQETLGGAVWQRGLIAAAAPAQVTAPKSSAA